MSTFKSNKYLKADARESLLGNLTTTVISVFVYTFATMMLSELVNGFNTRSVFAALLLSIVIFFVVNTCGNMLRIGLSCIFLKLQFRQKTGIGDLLYAFRSNSDTAVILSAFIAVLELLCMMPYILFLLFVSKESFPSFGIVSVVLLIAGFLGTLAVRIRYAMCTYLFLDFTGFSARELIRGGSRLLQGHLLRLFGLYLSFLPLYFLSVPSLGVAGLWVSSYTHAAEAAFYKDLMANTAF